MRNVLLLAKRKALGECPCRAWRDFLDHADQSGVRTEGGGGRHEGCATGHCTCCALVLLWPGWDHRQPLLRGRDPAEDTMTPKWLPQVAAPCGSSSGVPKWLPQVTTPSDYPKWLPQVATPSGYPKWLPQLTTPSGYPKWLPQVATPSGCPM